MPFKGLILLIIVVLIIACGDKEDHLSYSYLAFPDIVKTNDGKILCVFYNGWSHLSLGNDKKGENNGGRILMIISSDSGRSWSESKIIIDTPMDDRDPSLLMVSDGTIICNFFSVVGTEKFIKLQTYTSTSFDVGAHWSNPKLAASGVATSSPIIETQKKFLLPVYDFLQNENSKCFVLESNDGVSWYSLKPIIDDRIIALSEPSLISFKDKIIAIARADDNNLHMQASESFDNGLTWGLKFDIGFPGEAPYLFNYNDSILLLAHRNPLTSIRYSSGNKLSFSEPVIIDYDREAQGSYPTLTQISKKKLLVAYYAQDTLNTNLSEIRFRYCFMEEEGIKVSGIISRISVNNLVK